MTNTTWFQDYLLIYNYKEIATDTKIDQASRIEILEIDPNVFGKWIFSKGGKTIKLIFSKNISGTIGCAYAKKNFFLNTK